ncbi:MAG TPA: TonB family protein [bacterium]|nr:TonB family protein [bacterium]HPR87485.1 TonB family protein [bacterium]
MKACTEMCGRIDRWIDDELDAADELAVLIHLADCSECRRYFRSMKKIARLARREEIEFPQEIDQRFLLRWSKPESRAGREVPLWRRPAPVPAFALAALILLLLVTVFFSGRYLEQRNGAVPPSLPFGSSPLAYELPPLDIWSSEGPAAPAHAGASAADEMAAAPFRSPRPLYLATPAFPARAREQGLEGEVLLAALIDAEGHPANVQVLQNIPAIKEFAEQAVTALTQSRFAPSLQYGRPVPSRVFIAYRFHNERTSPLQEFARQFI